MDVNFGHGMRWITIHSTQQCCREAHSSSFEHIKSKINTASILSPPAPDPIPILLPEEPEPVPTLVPVEPTTGAGWVYCFENDAMPGIYKVGVTRRTPTHRLAEANGSNTWVPRPFTIVMAKSTTDAFITEKWLHQRLTELGFRVNRRREFFNAPLEVLQTLFGSIEGEVFTE